MINDSLLTVRRVAAIVLTAAISFHWIPNYWWNLDQVVMGSLPRVWEYSFSMLTLGFALTIWSPRMFGLGWEKTWKERRLIAIVGGGILAVVITTMLFIRLPAGMQHTAMYTLVPLAEELLFRGFLFSVLTDAFHGKVDVRYNIELTYPTIISAIAFGLWHLGGLQMPENGFVMFQVAYTTVAGLLFGYLRQQTRSLWSPWLIHFLVNLWAVKGPDLIHF